VFQVDLLIFDNLFPQLHSERRKPSRIRIFFLVVQFSRSFNTVARHFTYSTSLVQQRSNSNESYFSVFTVNQSIQNTFISDPPPFPGSISPDCIQCTSKRGERKTKK
jgi:hypothetical protein